MPGPPEVIRRWWVGTRAALTPTAAPWAIGPALAAAASGAVITGYAVVSGRYLAAVLMYFGASCAAVFQLWGGWRHRAWSVVTQAVGASGGLLIGAATATWSTPGVVIVAAAVAFVSGAVGAIGRLVTAGALMAVIGVTFGQFARLDLSGWAQSGLYLLGSAIVLAFALLAQLLTPAAPWRAAVADQLERAADLLAVVGTPAAAARRVQLSAASGRAWAEVYDHRLGGGFEQRSQAARSARLAQEIALFAAARYAVGSSAATASVAAVRALAAAVRARQPEPEPVAGIDDDLRAVLASGGRAVPYRRISPWPVRVRTALAAALTPGALWAGVRLAWCIAISVVITSALHNETHSFWLPLTVAVVVRPEYASVFLRAVNRAVGTLLGALLAAVLILLLDSGTAIAIAATVCLAFAVFAAPRLYALAVIGVTGSALLSACIAAPDPVYPLIRVVDTLIGCGVALVFGYLLWPRRDVDDTGLQAADRAAEAYLHLAARPADERPGWTGVQVRAYGLAHRARALAAERQQQPLYGTDTVLVELAIALEDVLDLISAVAGPTAVAGSTAVASTVAAPTVAGHAAPDTLDLLGQARRRLDEIATGIAAADHTH
jgi:uncharacterized membrane protein YccC